MAGIVNCLYISKNDLKKYQDIRYAAKGVDFSHVILKQPAKNSPNL